MKDPELGDWICFMNNGSLEYGKVAYIHFDEKFPKNNKYFTHKGAVTKDSILEVRPAEKELLDKVAGMTTEIPKSK